MMQRAPIKRFLVDDPSDTLDDDPTQEIPTDLILQVAAEAQELRARMTSEPLRTGAETAAAEHTTLAQATEQKKKQE